VGDADYRREDWNLKQGKTGWVPDEARSLTEKKTRKEIY